MILGVLGPEDAAAPGAVYLEVGLTALLAYCVLFGMRATYVHTFGAFLRKLSDLFTHKIPFTNISLPGGGAVASALDKADHFVQREMGSGLLALETVIGKWWHSLAWVVRMTADSLADFGHDVHAAIDSLVHGFIPGVVHGATHPIAGRVGKLYAALGRLEHTLERDLTRKANALESQIEHDFGKAWRGIDHLRGSLSGALAHVLTVTQADIAALRRYAHRVLSRRISRVEALLGAGLLSATAIAALTRVFPWWKCTNVRKLMRGTCRANPAWLELLFGAGVEALIVEDLCDFIAAVSAAAHAAQPALLAFVEVEDVLIGCHGMTKPAPLPIPALEAPPVSSGLALAA